MAETMKSILTRVLSQEIAHQEQWKKEDLERFGKNPIDRDKIVAEVKDFMKENNIDFSYDWYFSI